MAILRVYSHCAHTVYHMTLSEEDVFGTLRDHNVTAQGIIEVTNGENMQLDSVINMIFII